MADRGVNAIGAFVAFCHSLTSEDFSLAVAEAGLEQAGNSSAKSEISGPVATKLAQKLDSFDFESLFQELSLSGKLQIVRAFQKILGVEA